MSDQRPVQAIPLISRALLVRRGELPGLVGGFAFFFCLLCSYYVLRPVRDEMGIRGGVENLEWLFTGTFVLMLGAVPLYGWLASRFSRRRLVPTVYGFFIACMAGFAVWLESGLTPAWAARAFFLWLSVFNLFVVSIFWSLMADLFDNEQAKRLFGAIAAGGSVGAIAGPGLTAALAERLGPSGLLPIAAAVLAATLPCLWVLVRWQDRHGHGGQEQGAALGGRVLDGLRSVLGSRYLQGVGGFIWLYTTLATFLYFAQAGIVADTFGDTGSRTAAFAWIDLATNTLTVGAQLFVAARLIRAVGLPATLALVPALLVGGFLVLAAAPVFAAIAAVQVVRRAGNYALARPGREMLFTPLSRSEKYKAKNVVDTLIYRGGDAIAGWLYAGLGGLGLAVPGVALVAVPISGAWAVLGWWLGRARDARVAEQAADEGGITPASAAAK
ncbi:ATP:ADP antiporter, AAA family [Limimonas halophila]|uniref:ATP:ADP antiporter, AAA family n=1 Tax=Limimonas halophila TaxID=1082479 RepID=A0A1G7L491_9PROT|nr:MFS transporter [Limimonas halophila]SDF44362.1 ATP:ADP antiporter, AAA family [Limimonas halophila]